MPDCALNGCILPENSSKLAKAELASIRNSRFLLFVHSEQVQDQDDNVAKKAKPSAPSSLLARKQMVGPRGQQQHGHQDPENYGGRLFFPVAREPLHIILPNSYSTDATPSRERT